MEDLDVKKNEIIAFYKTGESCKTISKRYNVSDHKIWRFLKKNNVQLRQQKPSFNDGVNKCCSSCKEIKSVNDFCSNKSQKDGLHNHCNTCRKKRDSTEKSKEIRRIRYSKNKTKIQLQAKILRENNKEHVSLLGKIRYRKNTNQRLFQSAKLRAKQHNLPFNIELSDILIPETCPILGIPIFVMEKHSGDNSPSLDRLIPSKGYVKGNVLVISHRANTIKNDSTIEELEKILDFLKNRLKNEKI